MSEVPNFIKRITGRRRGEFSEGLEQLKKIKIGGKTWRLGQHLEVTYQGGRNASGRLDKIIQLSKGNVSLNLTIPLDPLRRGVTNVYVSDIEDIREGGDPHA